MLALKNILCPLDHGAASDDALRYAVTLAHAFHAKLILCHCTPEIPEDNAEKRTAVREFFRNALMRSVHTPLDTQNDPPIEGYFVQGDALTEIPRVAAHFGNDLIVMRSRRRPVAAALLGSTAEAVCHRAHCSVLVTHPDEREWKGLETGEIKLQRILVATDFSADGSAAVDFALSLAQEYQAELDLMHILQAAPVFALAMSDSRSPSGSDIHQAMLQLRSAVPSEAFLWSTLREIVREGVPHREILRYSTEHPINLICLGVHGSGYSDGTIFGSNSDRVLRNAPCPVLIARTNQQNSPPPVFLPPQLLGGELW
jgi:nucleotide-binding universal stress UspA family protein